MHVVTSDYAGMITKCDIRCWCQYQDTGRYVLYQDQDTGRYVLYQDQDNGWYALYTLM